MPQVVAIPLLTREPAEDMSGDPAGVCAQALNGCRQLGKAGIRIHRVRDQVCGRNTLQFVPGGQAEPEDVVLEQWTDQAVPPGVLGEQVLAINRPPHSAGEVPADLTQRPVPELGDRPPGQPPRIGEDIVKGPEPQLSSDLCSRRSSSEATFTLRFRHRHTSAEHEVDFTGSVYTLRGQEQDITTSGRRVSSGLAGVFSFSAS